MLNRLRKWTSQGHIWPPIDCELSDLRDQGLLKGTVLNAGSGWRDIGHLIEGTLINQDISWPGDTRSNLDIISPIHDIPRPDGTFDCVLCIAVLEHVRNPTAVVAELFRVTKAGGVVIASVPFLQPEHKIPTDYQRYTRDGLEVLFADAGYVVRQCVPIYTIYHTLHWITYEWLHLKDTIFYKLLRIAILPALSILAKRSNLSSEKMASVFRIVADKPGQGH